MRHPGREFRRINTNNGRRWARLREALFRHPDWDRWQLAGFPGGREDIARGLDLGRRTIERYESEEAPGWYIYALIGLAVARSKQAAKLPDAVRAMMDPARLKRVIEDELTRGG